VARTEEAMRTIGEVAASLDLPAHVLRFWETRFRQISPLKRAGGRRFYRQRDIDLVIAIRRLLYDEGYTIRGVQRILKENGVEAVIAGAGRKRTGMGSRRRRSRPARATTRTARPSMSSTRTFPATGKLRLQAPKSTRLSPCRANWPSAKRACCARRSPNWRNASACSG